jgi:hypothetical protein
MIEECAVVACSFPQPSHFDKENTIHDKDYEHKDSLLIQDGGDYGATQSP